MSRTASRTRSTKETNIELHLDVDGSDHGVKSR